MCNQTPLLLYLKRTSVLISKYFAMVMDLIALRGIIWLTCTQNVGMGRDVGRLMSWCDVVTWSAIIWDMWNVIKGKRHWNYFNCCNKVCKQIYFLLKCFLLEYWMHVLVSLHLKRAMCCLWVDYLKWTEFRCCGK